MTTIVYRDGILAADTRGYSGDVTPIGSKRKIFTLENGGLVGVSTPNPGFSEAIVKWMNNGRDLNDTPVDDPSFSALYIDANGEVFYFDDGYTPSGPLTAEYFAIGSGRAYAYGALSMGASSVEAVRAASDHDVFTSGEILTLTLKDASRKKKDHKIGFSN